MFYKFNLRAVKIKQVIVFVLITTFLVGGFLNNVKTSQATIILGQLEMTVFNSNSSEPLSNQEIIILDLLDPTTECPPDEELEEWQYCENDVGWGHITLLDENGKYFEDLSARNYDWLIDAEGYERQAINFEINVSEITLVNVNLVPEVQEPEPVILIPGIQASWPDFNGELKIDPFLKTYENLLDALRLAGYVDEVTLFQFPYEWRQDNNLTALDLKSKIDEIKSITGKPKVDLIGHSMGGIVSRAYIQSDYYEDDVDQVIFLGTPQIGSVHAYIPWEGGVIASEGVTDILPKIMTRLFRLEAAKEDFLSLFDYIRAKVLSVQQLLPIFNYLRDKGETELRIYDPINYPNNYPRNEFLEQLNLPENVNKLKSRVRITNIVSNLGPGSTIDVLRVVPYTDTDGKWGHGYPEGYNLPFGDHGLEYNPGEGDETVPFPSATALEEIPYTLCQSVHRPMPTNCQKLVIQALIGQVPAEFVNKDRFNGLNYVKAFIMMWFFSPVDFNIEDGQGNKVGQDLSTGNEVNEIQGAFVGQVGNKKVVFVPNPNNGEYKINLKGTGDGEYELNIVKGNEEDSQETVVTGTINTGQEKTYVTNYDEENDEPLVIEEVKEEVTFQSVRGKVREFYEQGLITKKSVKNYLIETLEGLEKKYEQLAKLKKLWQKEVWKKVIILGLEVEKMQIKYWHKKGLIKSPANDILINNFNSLIQVVKSRIF